MTAGTCGGRDAVVYEVYPRSFADSDGDGVGDLPGLRSRLGYLADLGVDAVWLTPFYPSPLADGGYDVSDYCDVDPLLGPWRTSTAWSRTPPRTGSGSSSTWSRTTAPAPIRCSAPRWPPRPAAPSGPGSSSATAAARAASSRRTTGRRSSAAPRGRRVTEADGRPGQWYLHLFDTSQPDWDWRNPDVPALFEDVIRFWLDRGVAGLRVDVAHGIFKDPGLPDLTGSQPLNAPSAYRHRPELQSLYRSWRAILDSYPAAGFPGARTAIGEVWYDVPETLGPYLEPGGLPQVFNFQLILAGWRAAEFRAAIDSALTLTGGSRAPWVIGNHDVARPASRYRLDEGFTPQTVSRLIALGDQNAGTGARRARAAALVLLALPGSAYIYQGEELGLPEVTDIPDEARQDPRFFRTRGEYPGRDGCRVPIPWSAYRYRLWFQPNEPGCLPGPPVAARACGWGRYSVESQLADEHSTLNLYRAALRLRRDHPALGPGALRWTGPEEGWPAQEEGGLLCFAREPGFILAANFGPAPAPLPAHREVLLASGPVAGGSLPPDTAAWLSA